MGSFLFLAGTPRGDRGVRSTVKGLLVYLELSWAPEPCGASGLVVALRSRSCAGRESCSRVCSVARRWTLALFKFVR